jgi:hypothetical protein
MNIKLKLSSLRTVPLKGGMFSLGYLALFTFSEDQVLDPCSINRELRRGGGGWASYRLKDWALS